MQRYAREVAELPTFAVGRDGFLSLKLHTEAAAEIYVMGVRSEHHRQGIGTVLLGAAEAFLRERAVDYLQVKTLGRRIRASTTPRRGASTLREGSARSRS